MSDFHPGRFAILQLCTGWVVFVCGLLCYTNNWCMFFYGFLCVVGA